MMMMMMNFESVRVSPSGHRTTKPTAHWRSNQAVKRLQPLSSASYPNHRTGSTTHVVQVIQSNHHDGFARCGPAQWSTMINHAWIWFASYWPSMTQPKRAVSSAGGRGGGTTGLWGLWLHSQAQWFQVPSSPHPQIHVTGLLVRPPSAAGEKLAPQAMDLASAEPRVQPRSSCFEDLWGMKWYVPTWTFECYLHLRY